MWTSYADSVLDAADADGNLSLPDAKRLMDEHGCCLASLCDDWTLNAEALLAYLGY